MFRIKEFKGSSGSSRTRKRRRIAVSTVVLAVFALAMTIQSAAAGMGWCRTDPLLLVDGQAVDVVVSGPLDAPLEVTGPTKIEVQVPKGVDAELIISDLGFGYGYDITIVETKKLKQKAFYNEVVVRTYVPANDSSMPVLLEVTPHLLDLLSPYSVEGTSNSWLSLEVKVPR